MLSSEGEDEIWETDPGGGIEMFYIKFILGTGEIGLADLYIGAM